MVQALDVAAVQARLARAGLYAGALDGLIGPLTWAAIFRFAGATDAAPPLGLAARPEFAGAGITSPLRIAHALAQWGTESGGFQRFEEDLNYSAPRLCAVWPGRFPTIASALPYANNPEALANRVYSARNGNTASGDGWRYRGRSPSQITGRANYEVARLYTGLPLIDQPDLAADPAHGIAIACSFWHAKGLNALADRDDIAAVRMKLNGGQIGIENARVRLARLKGLLL